MSTISDFVGIKYGFRSEPGLDCYQLVAAVSRDIFNNAIPDFAHPGTWKDADESFNAHKGEFEKVSKPVPGDLVLLKLGGKPIHCGIVIRGQQMLHSLRGANSCVERFDSLKWKTRIEGFYRWNSH